jgi:predicted aspartyl protease
LVDTGAAYTAISTRLATLFDPLTRAERQVTIAPVHSTILKVPQVLLPELRLGGMELMGVEALVVLFSSVLRLHGIVGMNVLRQFRMTLENDPSTLVLRAI